MYCTRGSSFTHAHNKTVNNLVKIRICYFKLYLGNARPILGLEACVEWGLIKRIDSVGGSTKQQKIIEERKELVIIILGY